MKTYREYLLLTMMAFFAAGTIFFACSKPAEPEPGIEVRLYNPDPLPEAADSIEVIVEYGGKSRVLFQGTKDATGFKGPYEGILEDYTSGGLNLIIRSWDAEGKPLPNVKYVYDMSGDKLTLDTVMVIPVIDTSEVDTSAVVDTSISIKSETLVVLLGDSTQLISWSVTPADAAVKLEWTSSETTVAQVASNGKVLPIARGNTVISVYIAGRSKIQDSIIVIVTDDSTQVVNQPPRCTENTVRLDVFEGDSVSISVKDSCADPDGNDVLSYKLITTDPKGVLAGKTFKFKAAPLDSGIYVELIEVSDGKLKDTLKIRIHVAPTYFTLTLTAENGTVNGAKDKTQYRIGEKVTLTAVPAAGYSFTGWSGDLDGKSNSVQLTMDSDKEIIADFFLSSVLECAVLKPGESINKAVSDIYTTPQKQGTICPEPGLYDDNTIGVSGKVEILIR